MENKQNSKKSTLINVALVVGGFVAGSIIWGAGSNFLKLKDSTNESVNKKSIEQANNLNTFARTTQQAIQPAGLVLTEQDKELIGKTAAQYLIDHPENLVEAGKRLESNRDGEKMSNVVNTKDVLLESTYTPNYGPENADVAVIEFFDYMCHFCQQSSPVLEKAISTNKNVRTFFKDFTIFADRTPISSMGAKIGLYIFKTYGQDKYYEFHNKLMNETGVALQARKDYSPQNLATLVHGLGYKDILDEHGNFLLATDLRDQLQNVLDANMMLADKLNYSGTPVFIVMNIKNPQNKTTTVMPGAPDYYRLQQAIDKAKGV
ncbi:DsbA family protein (plasmid) [Klebsiella michiganensis]|uniref:DsbA family protein n=1 Tax=Klebsiella michiganensis TaxID=1134687 RepID=UPI0021DA9958|nr:DsbA family protein [Klebsiella michiganensis]UYB60079.1 DsbA family protein [Klebsiella michiganensis]